MNVGEIVSALDLTVESGSEFLSGAVTCGYASDLLSNVMGQAPPGSIWVTMQGHQNIVAVAALSGLAAVITAGGVKPDPEAINKAKAERVVILSTGLPVFEVVGRLYQLGVKGA